MISEEKRRRIAKMLRDATEGHGDVPGIPDSEVFCIFEIGTGFADGFADKTDVEALADLIDRPKAKREDAGNYWRCGHCGAFNRKDAVTNCFGVIPSRRCGNCGREWEK